AVNVQRAARSPRLSDFEQCSPGADAVADAERADVETTGGQVFAHGPIVDWEATLHQLVDHFGRNQEYGFTGTAVNVGVRVLVTLDPQRGNESFRKRRLGQSSGRDVHLLDDALQILMIAPRHPPDSPGDASMEQAKTVRTPCYL